MCWPSRVSTVAVVSLAIATTLAAPQPMLMAHSGDTSVISNRGESANMCRRSDARSRQCTVMLRRNRILSEVRWCRGTVSDARQPMCPQNCSIASLSAVVFVHIPEASGGARACGFVSGPRAMDGRILACLTELLASQWHMRQPVEHSSVLPARQIDHALRLLAPAW